MRKILIVEDDRELKEGICYALQKAGYLTESADSVQNAKTLFLKEGADVILLDVNLPDGEGFDFCKWVKERTLVPVLFLTARDLEEDALCGYEAGAEDYVLVISTALNTKSTLAATFSFVQKRFETGTQMF